MNAFNHFHQLRLLRVASPASASEFISEWDGTQIQGVFKIGPAEAAAAKKAEDDAKAAQEAKAKEEQERRRQEEQAAAEVAEKEITLAAKMVSQTQAVAQVVAAKVNRDLTVVQA